MSDSETRSRARERALRAARAVTVTVTLALGAGGLAACTSSHDPTGTDPVIADAGTDAASVRDGVCDRTGSAAWSDPDCCDESGGFWVEGGGCAVPGPFVPPSMASA